MTGESITSVPLGVDDPAATGAAGRGDAAATTSDLTPYNSLSPSRASDFMSCPLKYRFRVIDRLPEAPSVAAVRGSVVHKVLEDLFDLPTTERTPARASLMIGPAWEQMLAEEPELAEMFADGAHDLAGWLEECRLLLARYFRLEDPARIEPAERELHVRHELGSGLVIHGYIDRLDRSAAGDLRIVDYKTGTAPDERFVARALFQMRFYALVVWRARGVIPRLLQLIYLGNGELVRYEPDEADLLATERKIEAIWRAVQRAAETGDWRPNRSPLCAWCDHQAICPAWGGTPPPLPDRTPAA